MNTAQSRFGIALSVRAANVLLRDLLGEIEAKTRIVIDLKEPNGAVQRASVEFENVPPAVALESILRDFNFAFFYSASRLARVLILRSGHRSPETRSALLEPGGTGSRVPRVEEDRLEFRKVPTLAERKIKHSDIVAKLEAIDWLEDSDDPKSVTALADALAIDHPKVKEAALRALSAKKDADVTPMLRRGLRDNDPGVSRFNPGGLGRSWRSRFTAESVDRSVSRCARNRGRPPMEGHARKVINPFHPFPAEVRP
jgi:hypothetical protein